MDEKCHSRVIRNLNQKGHKIDVRRYDRCLKTQLSYIDNHQPNKGYLHRDMEYKKKTGNYLNPSISINNQTFKGDYHKPNEIFKSICNVLKSKPKFCRAVSIENFQLPEDMTTIKDMDLKQVIQDLHNREMDEHD